MRKYIILGAALIVGGCTNLFERIPTEYWVERYRLERVQAEKDQARVLELMQNGAMFPEDRLETQIYRAGQDLQAELDTLDRDY